MFPVRKRSFPRFNASSTWPGVIRSRCSFVKGPLPRVPVCADVKVTGAIAHAPIVAARKRRRLETRAADEASWVIWRNSADDRYAVVRAWSVPRGSLDTVSRSTKTGPDDVLVCHDASWLRVLINGPSLE